MSGKNKTKGVIYILKSIRQYHKVKSGKIRHHIRIFKLKRKWKKHIKKIW